MNKMQQQHTSYDTEVAATIWTKLPQNQKPRAPYTTSCRRSFPTQSCPTAPTLSPASQPVCGFTYPTTNHTALGRVALHHPAGTATLSSTPILHPEMGEEPQGTDPKQSHSALNSSKIHFSKPQTQ